MNNKSTKNIKRIIYASFFCFHVICICFLFSFAMFCRLHCFVVYVVLKSPLHSRFHGFASFILFCLVSFVFFSFFLSCHYFSTPYFYRLFFRIHCFIVFIVSSSCFISSIVYVSIVFSCPLLYY